MIRALASDPRRRARWLLSIGAALGLGLAAASLLSGGDGRPLPADAAARVNGVVIRKESYARLLAAVEGDRRTPLEAADRRRVLDRMIEEELLVQHALALGLARSDRRVRADLVSAVLASLGAAADAYEPEPDEIAGFFAANSAYFARPGRLHVRSLTVQRRPGESETQARERATQAAARLRAGEAFASVQAELGEEPVAPLPDAPLPPAKLREYLGPAALEAALALPDAGVGGPLETPQGLLVLQLVARSDVEAPPLAEVEAQVRAEMRRREGDRVLRERLDALRAEADVSVSEPLE